MYRRTFLSTAAAVLTAPCLGRAAAATALRFVPTTDVTVLDPKKVRPRRQVRNQDLHRTAGFCPQALGQRVQPGFIPRHQDQVVAAAGQAVGVDGADAGRRAGDQRGVGC